MQVMSCVKHLFCSTGNKGNINKPPVISYPAVSPEFASFRQRMKSLTVSVIVRFSCSAYLRSFSISSLVRRSDSLVSAGRRVLVILSLTGCTTATQSVMLNLTKKGGYLTSILAKCHKVNKKGYRQIPSGVTQASSTVQMPWLLPKQGIYCRHPNNKASGGTDACCQTYSP